LSVLNFSFKKFFRFEKAKPDKSMGSACLIIVFLLIFYVLSEALQVLAALWFVFIFCGSKSLFSLLKYYFLYFI